MAFYDLSKEERKQKYIDIQDHLYRALQNKDLNEIHPLFDHKDTYYRKAAYFMSPIMLRHGRTKKYMSYINKK